MARVADVDRDPGGPGRRHEAAVVVDLDRDDRHAPGRDAERDPVADRAESRHDDVVADVRPARSRRPSVWSSRDRMSASVMNAYTTATMAAPTRLSTIA